MVKWDSNPGLLFPCQREQENLRGGWQMILQFLVRTKSFGYTLSPVLEGACLMIAKKPSAAEIKSSIVDVEGHSIYWQWCDLHHVLCTCKGV